MKKRMVLNGIILSLPIYAATPVMLDEQSSTFLKNTQLTATDNQIKEISRLTDRNNTLHIRIQQTFKGYPVYGADSVIHIPQAGNSKKPYTSLLNDSTFMNGNFYLDIEKDLTPNSQDIFSKKQADLAINKAIHLYQQDNQKTIQPSEKKAQLIVFIDSNNKAHWAFRVSFFIENAQDVPERPTFLMDALDDTIYDQWNDIKTKESLDIVRAGGFGGNHKTGQKIFDGAENHLNSMHMRRDEASKTCHMKNSLFQVIDYVTRDTVKFPCEALNVDYNNIYWNGNFDEVYTTWSPSNDVLFGAEATYMMFREWYGIPVLVENGQPMMLPLEVHSPMTNAYWNGYVAAFGNSLGSKTFNPFTQLDTVSHELCHGFTEQNSNLEYRAHSGGINEAFSDMAGIAAEYYVYGETQYLVGFGDVRAENESLRYMDKPSKDCKGGKPGNYCSIDHFSQYKSSLNVHYSSGLFNRVYYLIATSENWNPEMAFNIMVKANMHYWTSNTTFQNAACGVLQSTVDYRYPAETVRTAFDTVGISYKHCMIHIPPKFLDTDVSNSA